MAGAPQNSTRPTMENKNVAGGQLAFFSNQPPTGFYRDGYCRTGPEDKGNHSVAAIVTEDFLGYSASQGNNLKDVGVKPGMKWCLCAKRWKDAFDAAVKGDLSQDAVPKVFLHASHESALNTLSLSDMKKFEAPRQAQGQKGRQDSHHNPEAGGGITKQANSLGGDMGSSAPSGKGRAQG